MAKQSNIFKMEGTLGGVTFYKSRQDGFLTKEKSSVSASRIKNDPGYARTRENMSEFGAAGKASQLLRHAFSSVIGTATDGRVISRLLQLVRAVIVSDTISVRGQRRLEKADMVLLADFDFNELATLSVVFKGVYKPAFVRATGAVTISFESFQSKKPVLAVPKGATHFKFVAAAALIDFAAGTRTMVSRESDMYPCDGNDVTPDALALSLPVASALPAFIALGIEFVQETNNAFYPLDDDKSNSFKLVRVEMV